MELDLNAARCFVKVVELGSFTQAANLLGLTQPGISKAVSRLEAQVGAKLIHRSTRQVRVTEDGQLFMKRIQPLIYGFEEAHSELKFSKTTPVGCLKLSAPSALSHSLIMPVVKLLTERYPDLRIELSLTDQKVHVFDEGYDAVLRFGSIDDERLVAFALQDAEWVTVASPEYLAKQGIPHHPDELRNFNCLHVKARSQTNTLPWRFRIDGKGIEYRQLVGNVCFDHGDPLIDAALQGLGVVQVLRCVVADKLANGELKEVLTDFRPQAHSFHLLYPPSRQRSAKLTVLREALIFLWGRKTLN
ncbi:LysR family transcriptional regulator [Vibrio mimicus]